MSAPPQFTSPRRVPRGIWFAAGASFLLYLIPALVLLRFYRQPAFDLAIYDQHLWLLARGEWFNTVAGIHVFGAHLSPVLLLLAPLSWIPGGAMPELVLQSVAIASGVFPAYRLATALERNPIPFVAIYAIHPAMFSGAWFGFRPWNLAAPFLMWAAWWMWTKPTSARLMLLGLAGFILREDIAAWVSLLGLTLVFVQRMRLREWLGVSIGLAGLTLLAVLVVLPQFSPLDGYLYADPAGDRGGGLIAVTTAAARGIYLLIPLGLGLRILPLRTLAPLAIPLAGLSYVGLTLIGARFPGFHYEMLFVPGMILAVLVGGDAVPSLRLVVIGATAMAVLLGPFRFFGVMTGPDPFDLDLAEARRVDSVRTAIDGLDDEARSMALPNHLVPHYSERAEIFIFPYPFDRVAREPYPMDCPAPDVVVTDSIIEGSASAWQVSSERYQEVYMDARYRVLVRTDETEQTGCGPALN